MEIRNRSTGAVTTVSQFKSEHPTTSFPKQITIEVLNSFGYDAVLNGPAATVTALMASVFVTVLKRLMASGLPSSSLVQFLPTLQMTKVL